MPPRTGIDPRFGARLRQLREARGWSLRQLGRAVPVSHVRVHQLEAGRSMPSPRLAERLDQVLDAGGALAALATATSTDGQMDATELLRRVEASDVSAGTLDRLEAAFDSLATAYPTTPPARLLPRVCQHLGYVGRLIHARKTLDQHRRLLVLGGWLSLLAATLSIDQRDRAAAAARLAAADQLAQHAGHAELRAWCLETRAWDVLTEGRYAQAVELSRQAQAVAPRASSAYIQAVAQEGRGWARMGRTAETRAALDRVARHAGALARPHQPEHHYRYDPGKALSYTATTLAWAGDPAAEQYARTVVSELEVVAEHRPRRLASARLDLALALLAAGKPDEAGAQALAAVISGRVVASNWWRAAEVLAEVERSGIREAGQLREACQTHRPRS
jgi:transcriptional regulator with XRE-family HTH domain